MTTEVHSGPFFVLVDGRAGRIATEGVAWSVAQITAAIAALGPPASRWTWTPSFSTVETGARSSPT